ncbi:serine hydrolase domain-containing protein [Paucibacter sp. APW11]|uniref:Serine hydrolase domain-containing protein n=1 Tax=Roseateles aquae TaxID=3077235 RepID=A0ABU3PFG5_9BURK|nr:serine hydrolase domain-containing protein [Paucibacter sp. APW11]MDT9001309.1 serine hydrolase domain-containing protein [Paucibacter sp. APW11]
MGVLQAARRALTVAGLSVSVLARAAAPQLNSADLSAFLDGHLPVEMARANVAGVGIAVVKDGKLLLARGYGLADREARRPVLPDETLFRIGSVSKLYVWMAVMQLQEQGRLDLDADVQRYLDFSLRSPELGAISLRQLMTHRAGFEETIAALWATPGEDMSLRNYLRDHQPARLFKPGAVPAYSNYGATLAAYIVERVSGEPFERYVKAHLLQPLGLAHTSFAQPLPAALKAGMSAGYELGSGKAQAFELIRVAPAGAASATVNDMARFMLAQLGGGQLDGQRVLKAETMRAMLSPQLRHHPAGPALGLGFYEEDGFGPQVIGHGGDTQWFHSGLYLLPEKGVGVFISQNSRGKRNLRGELMKRLVERYFPPASAQAEQAKPDPSIAGIYQSSRRIDSGPLRMGYWFGQTRVSIDEQGRLSSSAQRGIAEQPVFYRLVGEGVWQAEDEGLTPSVSRRLFFRKDPVSGRWEMSGRSGVQIEQQVGGAEDGRWLASALGASLGLALLTLLAWPMAVLARRHYRRPEPMPLQQHARKSARWAALLMLVPWLTLGAFGLASQGDLAYLGGSLFGAAVRLSQLLGWLSVPALFLAGRGLWLHWRCQDAWWWARLHGLLLLLAALLNLLLAWRGQLMLGS